MNRFFIFALLAVFVAVAAIHFARPPAATANNILELGSFMDHTIIGGDRK